mmetsp:Transcript_61427/g.171730  ORF Transcript_61427/g.171730 Transcript_61427/m.171730 type:complete len:234 (-) Transcript_61427:1815-2516(-)
MAVEKVDQALVQEQAIALKRPQVRRHLPGPQHGHADALAVQAQRPLGHVDTPRPALRVEAVGEGLDAMAQGVRVLEEQRTVLFEGIRISKEHGLGCDDLSVDHSEEILDALPILAAQNVELVAQPAHHCPPELEHGLEVIVAMLPGFAQHGDTLAESDDLGLGIRHSRTLDEGHEPVETADRLHNLRSVRRELTGPEDVVVIARAHDRARDAKHVHRLGRFTDGRVDVGRRTT